MKQTIIGHGIPSGYRSSAGKAMRYSLWHGTDTPERILYIGQITARQGGDNISSAVLRLAQSRMTGDATTDRRMLRQIIAIIDQKPQHKAIVTTQFR